MGHTAFKRREAQAKVGTRVRARAAVTGIPRDTVGAVTRVDRVLDGYDVEVTWVWPGRRTPWVDWWTKAEYEAHLAELPPRGGAR